MQSINLCASARALTTTMAKSTPVCESGDEDMAPSDTTIEYKLSSFLYLQNDISKNLLLPNIGTFNVHRNKGDDNVHFGKTLYESHS